MMYSVFLDSDVCLKEAVYMFSFGFAIHCLSFKHFAVLVFSLLYRQYSFGDEFMNRP